MLRYSEGDLPNKYSLIELTDAVLHSNRLKNYTVYISELHEIEGYAVLLGCDSHIVTKITFNAKGETSRIIFGSILVFCVVTIIVVLCSSYIFSRKITNPVGDIIEDIRCKNTEPMSAGLMVLVIPSTRPRSMVVKMDLCIPMRLVVTTL